MQCDGNHPPMSEMKDALQESAMMIQMLLVLAAGCKDHPGYRGRAKPHRQCESCEVIWVTATKVRNTLIERSEKLKDLAEKRVITPATKLVGPDGQPI